MKIIRSSLIKYSCILLILNVQQCLSHCTVPFNIQGSWFSLENGQNILSVINSNSMSHRGNCVAIKHDNKVNYTIVFKNNSCYTCVRVLVRTINVLEKIETPCMSIENEQNVTVENVCKDLRTDQQLITLFSENYVPVNCQSSLEGVWNFSYQNRFKFTGTCNHPDAHIRSCQAADSQLQTSNRKFNITYKKCANINGSFEEVVEYSCLGDWVTSKKHYFAVVNTRETRIAEKYRCFLKNRDDDLLIGVSTTAECNTLKTVKESPEMLRIKPVKTEVVEPRCRLPANFAGEWINTANFDADIQINETHIVETWFQDEKHYKRTIYVCKEIKDTRVMMARVTIDGCQKDHICFNFVPKQDNIIRYRKGIAVTKEDFHTVCSVIQFQNKDKWKYDLFLKKHPGAVKCPVAGKFKFIQKGDIPFKTKIIRGITLPPRSGTRCKQNISVFSVCDTNQTKITIDENYCLSVDYLGRPVYVFNEPDYRMMCTGFWKENQKSYLVTFDNLDPFSKYRCWVYQRSDSNTVLMSQAIGTFCDLKQDATSWNYTEGAAVAIEMQEYEEDLGDKCPKYFDEGIELLDDEETTTTEFDLPV